MGKNGKKYVIGLARIVECPFSCWMWFSITRHLQKLEASLLKWFFYFLSAVFQLTKHMQWNVPNIIFLILTAFKTPLYFTATNKPCTGNPIQCFGIWSCLRPSILMMRIEICTTRIRSARPIGLDRGAKILFKRVHFGVFNVSFRASSVELGEAAADLLWSKNVIKLTRPPIDIFW